MIYDISTSGEYLLITPSGSLDYNQEYIITISGGILGINPDDTEIVSSDTYSFWFTSQYCPLFTTATKVKLIAGPVSDSVLDDTINRMIYRNSLDIINIYNMNGANIDPLTWGCGPDNIPYEFARYVECKTAYDILSLIDQLKNSAMAGGQTKTLGDLTIKYDGSSNVTVDPQRKNDLYECFNSIIRSLLSINVAVRGWNDTTKGWSHPVKECYENRVTRPNLIRAGYSQYTPYGRKNF